MLPSHYSSKLTVRSFNGTFELGKCTKLRKKHNASSDSFVAMEPPAKKKKKFLSTLELKDLPYNNGSLPDQFQGKQTKTKKRKYCISSNGSSCGDSIPQAKDAKVRKLMIKSQCYGSTLVSDHSFQPKVSLTKSHGFPSSLVIKKEDYPQKLFKLPRTMTENNDKKEADIVSKMGFSDDVIPHQSVLCILYHS